MANYNSQANSDLHRRYFGPRMPPIFVNSGGKTITVTVGDTVTIPCKIHNKGKQFYLSTCNKCKALPTRPVFMLENILAYFRHYLREQILILLPTWHFYAFCHQSLQKEKKRMNTPLYSF